MRASPGSATLVLLLLLTLAPGAAADVGFGVKGGLSVSTLHGRLPTDGLLENAAMYGFAGGAWATLPLGRAFALQAEVVYVAKGTSLGKVALTDSGGSQVGTAEVIEAVEYLELPLLLRVGLPLQGRLDPYLLAGPVVGLRLSQRLKLTGDASASTPIDFFRRADLGVALATGFEMGRGPARGAFEVRYTLGLTPATEDAYSDAARNGSFQLMAGLVLRR